MAAKNHIELVLKTLAVMESLAESEHGKALRDIAIEVGLVKSSVFRILYTLKEAGYVEQPETNGLYRLTLRTAGLARRNAGRLGLTELARPHLSRLRDVLDESVAIAERRAHSIVLVDALESSHPLRLTFHIGDICPIHATALGKAVAAYLSLDEVAALLNGNGLTPFTSHTNTRMHHLKAELAQAHRTGYTLNDEETVSGALILGAALFDASDTVCGAISINTPKARCPERRKRLLIESVVKAARAISSDLSNANYINPHIHAKE